MEPFFFFFPVSENTPPNPIPTKSVRPISVPRPPPPRHFKLHEYAISQNAHICILDSNSVAVIQREARRRKMLSKPRQSSWAAGMTEAAAKDRRDRQAAAADSENGSFFCGSNDSFRPPRSSGEFNIPVSLGDREDYNYNSTPRTSGIYRVAT